MKKSWSIETGSFVLLKRGELTRDEWVLHDLSTKLRPKKSGSSREVLARRSRNDVRDGTRVPAIEGPPRVEETRTQLLRRLSNEKNFREDKTGKKSSSKTDSTKMKSDVDIADVNKSEELRRVVYKLHSSLAKKKKEEESLSTDKLSAGAAKKDTTVVHRVASGKASSTGTSTTKRSRSAVRKLESKDSFFAGINQRLSGSEPILKLIMSKSSSIIGEGGKLCASADDIELLYEIFTDRNISTLAPLTMDEKKQLYELRKLKWAEARKKMQVKEQQEKEEKRRKTSGAFTAWLQKKKEQEMQMMAEKKEAEETEEQVISHRYLLIWPTRFES